MTKRILLVDDEDRVLHSFTRNLELEYEVYTASGADRALEVIDEDGPFAVIITDMRMPDVDGLEFIKRARDVAPHSVYMMLTGNQDLETATAAINEGQIFRFMNKPIAMSPLRATLDAGLRQYELINLERELLQRTFCGAVTVLTDLLESSHRDLFGRASAIETFAKGIQTHLGIEERWEFRLACRLSLIGFMSLPEEENAAYGDPTISDEEWLTMLNEASQIGRDLLRKIPRIETVADIIGDQARTKYLRLAHRSVSNKEVVATGAALLRLSLHAERLASSGLSCSQALQEIRESLPAITLDLEDALESCWPKGVCWATEFVKLDQLCERMVVADDVVNVDGSTLVRKGRRLTSTIIDKLHCPSSRLGTRSQLAVYTGNRAAEELTPVIA